MGLKEQTQTEINNINTSLQVFFFNESNILPLLRGRTTEMVMPKEGLALVEPKGLLSAAFSPA